LNLGKKSLFDISSLNGFTNSRVIELFVSLLAVAPTEEIQGRLVQCMKDITQSRLDEEQASIDARVFEAILRSEEKVESGKLSTRAITETFNDGLPEKDQGSSRFIGRKVAALGFEKCRLSGGPSGFYWDLKLIERLRARYFPTGSKTTSLTSQNSQTSLDMVNQAQKEESTSEQSEEKPSLEHQEKTQNTVKSEVNEQSEVSEGLLETLAKETLSLERLTGLFEEKCVVCGFQGALDFQVNKFDGSWGLLCDRCGLELEKRLHK
jgi:hypothetical protein